MKYIISIYSRFITDKYYRIQNIIPAPGMLAYLLFFGYLLTSGCHQQDTNRDLIVLGGLTMGTTYTVKLYTNEVKNRNPDIKRSIENTLEKINAIMSTYIPDSELSRINSSLSTDWIPVSDELFEVIKSGIEVGVASNGAFDITVGPLVNIWGFGPIDTGNRIPDQATIEGNLAYVNFRKLHLDDKNKKIRKELPEIYIDLSGIAKGYAVDRIASLLEEKYSLENFLVEIGGEISTRGKNPDGQSWHIGVEMPVTDDRTAGYIVNLENMAMASSGDYRNYFELDGIHYSHSIDPKTGKPVTHNLASVTVLHRQCMLADAWATAILVAGPETAKHLAQQNDLPVLFITRKADGFDQYYNSKFSLFVRE